MKRVLFSIHFHLEAFIFNELITNSIFVFVEVLYIILIRDKKRTTKKEFRL
jgi:hypothetical protein